MCAIESTHQMKWFNVLQWKNCELINARNLSKISHFKVVTIWRSFKLFIGKNVCLVMVISLESNHLVRLERNLKTGFFEMQLLHCNIENCIWNAFDNYFGSNRIKSIHIKYSSKSKCNNSIDISGGYGGGYGGGSGGSVKVIKVSICLNMRKNHFFRRKLDSIQAQ